jgi:hypothetical protein
MIGKDGSGRSFWCCYPKQGASAAAGNAQDAPPSFEDRDAAGTDAAGKKRRQAFQQAFEARKGWIQPRVQSLIEVRCAGC